MAKSRTKDQLIATIERLNDDQQAHLLTVAQRIQASPRRAGKSRRDAKGHFTLTPGEVDHLMRIIENGDS